MNGVEWAYAEYKSGKSLEVHYKDGSVNTFHPKMGLSLEDIKSLERTAERIKIGR